MTDISPGLDMIRLEALGRFASSFGGHLQLSLGIGRPTIFSEGVYNLVRLESIFHEMSTVLITIIFFFYQEFSPPHRWKVDGGNNRLSDVTKRLLWHGWFCREYCGILDGVRSSARLKQATVRSLCRP